MNDENSVQSLHEVSPENINNDFFAQPSFVFKQWNVYHCKINQKILSFVFDDLENPEKVDQILENLDVLEKKGFDFKKPVRLSEVHDCYKKCSFIKRQPTLPCKRIGYIMVHIRSLAL
jgi:hypothetical protein